MLCRQADRSRSFFRADPDRARPAYQRAKEIDGKLIAEMQKA